MGGGGGTVLGVVQLLVETMAVVPLTPQQEAVLHYVLSHLGC